MSTNYFLKKFLLDSHTIPELSQIYHHVYFRDLQEKLIATNDLMARFIGFSCHVKAQDRCYKELIQDPAALQQVLDNDQMVLKNNGITLMNESIVMKKQKYNLLSIESPLYNENAITGICGISIMIDGINFTHFRDIFTIIGNLLHQNLPIDLKIGLSTQSQTTRPKLTPREKDCLYLYMKGNTTKSIANILGLSNRTIEHYIDNIKSKLGVNKRSELLSLAFNLYSDLT